MKTDTYPLSFNFGAFGAQTASIPIQNAESVAILAYNASGGAWTWSIWCNAVNAFQSHQWANGVSVPNAAMPSLQASRHVNAVNADRPAVGAYATNLVMGDILVISSQAGVNGPVNVTVVLGIPD